MRIYFKQDCQNLSVKGDEGFSLVQEVPTERF
jgi:hypothetical protein